MTSKALTIAAHGAATAVVDDDPTMARKRRIELRAAQRGTATLSGGVVAVSGDEESASSASFERASKRIRPDGSGEAEVSLPKAAPAAPPKSSTTTTTGNDVTASSSAKKPSIRGIKKQARYEPGVPMTKAELREWRKEARRVRNRESAAASRVKTRTKIEELEGVVDQIQSKYNVALQRILEVERILRRNALSAVSEIPEVIRQDLLEAAVGGTAGSTVPSKTSAAEGVTSADKAKEVARVSPTLPSERTSKTNASLHNAPTSSDPFCQQRSSSTGHDAHPCFHPVCFPHQQQYSPSKFPHFEPVNVATATMHYNISQPTAAKMCHGGNDGNGNSDRVGIVSAATAAGRKQAVTETAMMCRPTSSRSVESTKEYCIDGAVPAVVSVVQNTNSNPASSPIHSSEATMDDSLSLTDSCGTDLAPAVSSLSSSDCSVGDSSTSSQSQLVSASGNAQQPAPGQSCSDEDDEEAELGEFLREALDGFNPTTEEDYLTDLLAF